MGDTTKAMSTRRGETLLSFVQLIYHSPRTYSLSNTEQTLNEDVNQNVEMRWDSTEPQQKGGQEQVLEFSAEPSDTQDGEEVK